MIDMRSTWLFRTIHQCFIKYDYRGVIGTIAITVIVYLGRQGRIKGEGGLCVCGVGVSVAPLPSSMGGLFRCPPCPFSYIYVSYISNFKDCEHLVHVHRYSQRKQLQVKNKFMNMQPCHELVRKACINTSSWL